MASAACVLQNPAALQPHGQFHPNAKGTSAQLWHRVLGPGGVGGPLPGTPGLSPMAPAGSQLCRMPPSKTSVPRDAAQASCLIPPPGSPLVALSGGPPLWHPSLSLTGLVLVPMLQTAQTTTDKRSPVPSSRSFYTQTALAALGGDLLPKPRSRGTLPTCEEQFPHPVSAPWTGSSLDPGWAGAGQDLQGWQGAGASCAEHRDVTTTTTARSCRARSPWGVLSPPVCFLSCSHLQISPWPHSAGLCTSPGREELGPSGCSGDSPGAATPEGAAVLGARAAPTGTGELTACGTDVLGALVCCLPTPVTARNCRGGAWGDVREEPSWCPTWLAGSGQGAGRERGLAPFSCHASPPGPAAPQPPLPRGS